MSRGPETPMGGFRKLSTGDGRKKSGWTDLVMGKDLKQGITAAKKRR